MRLWPRREEKRDGFDLSWLAQQWATFNFQGNEYGGYLGPQGYTTTYGNEKAEPIPSNFEGLVRHALDADGVVAAVELVRLAVFSEARFQFQGFNGGRPGDLFGDTSLEVLEHPFPGGTTGDLLGRMLVDADFAGNAYVARIGDELVRLRPDWVEILLADRRLPLGPENEMVTVGYQRAGYFYYEGGKGVSGVPAVFLPDEVAHFAPNPDPLATFRGRSWLTPVIREVMADKAATQHKLKFFENAATPNLAVSLKPSNDQTPMTPEQFEAFVDAMDRSHKGVHNAYKTLYTANGADVTVIGANMQQLDFKATQGAGETRIAAAGRVHPVLVGLSEGLGGSALNAGNYNSAKRAFADGEMRRLWRNVAGSLEVIVPPPSKNARLWYDSRDVAFLREDEKDAADIQFVDAQSMKTLIDAGYTPESAKTAVTSGDLSRLVHSGLVSVQLQVPGSSPAAPTDPTPGEAA
jgi:phage portal protein BeeE